MHGREQERHDDAVQDHGGEHPPSADAENHQRAGGEQDEEMPRQEEEVLWRRSGDPCTASGSCGR